MTDKIFEVKEIELNKKYFIGDLNKYFSCKIFYDNEWQYLHIPTLNNTIKSKYFKFIINNNKIELINL